MVGLSTLKFESLSSLGQTMKGLGADTSFFRYISIKLRGAWDLPTVLREKREKSN